MTAEPNLKGHNYEGKMKGSMRDYNRNDWFLTGGRGFRDSSSEEIIIKLWPEAWPEYLVKGGSMANCSRQGKSNMQILWLMPKSSQGKATNLVISRLFQQWLSDGRALTQLMYWLQYQNLLTRNTVKVYQNWEWNTEWEWNDRN